MCQTESDLSYKHSKQIIRISIDFKELLKSTTKGVYPPHTGASPSTQGVMPPKMAFLEVRSLTYPSSARSGLINILK